MNTIKTQVVEENGMATVIIGSNIGKIVIPAVEDMYIPLDLSAKKYHLQTNAKKRSAQLS